MEPETPDIIIAKLVLGYLKTKHYRTAYKEFFKDSIHLRQKNRIKGKYLCTRFMGRSLEDILKDYFELHVIVQAKLEDTNYFEEIHPNSNLVQQVLYLLSRCNSSRTSTPCPRSPSDSRFGEVTPSYQDVITDVEATPAYSLPGNKQCIPKQTLTPKLNSTLRNISPCSPENESTETIVNNEYLAQTLLENEEFHEKIAQTINKVAEQQRERSALDKTVENVVKETQKDPIFDKLLDEIIESINCIEDSASKSETNNTDTSSDMSKNKDNSETNKNGISQCPQNKYDQNSSKTSQVQANPDTIKCISEEPVKNTPDKTQQNNEVIVFEGSLDNYLVSTACPVVATVPNPVRSGLFIPTNLPYTFRPEVVSQYIVVPKPVTEQDIMAMPTVIVNEELNQPSKLQMEQYKPKKSQNFVKILPATSRPETISPLVSKPSQQGLKKVIYPKKVIDENSGSAAAIKTDVTSDPHVINQANCIPEVTNENRIELKEITPKTPPPPDNVQKVTPKSSSHVRNLDFSTPPKITSSVKKSLRIKRENTSTKRASKSLFKNKKTTTEVTTTWDSTLRAPISQSLPCSSTTPKVTRKKTQSKNPRKREKKKKEATLNDTLTDGALIEAALQTPMKSEIPLIEDNLSTFLKSGNTEKAAEIPIENNQISEKKLSEENSFTTLSPSKLNGSKRNILVKDIENCEKFITPENKNESSTTLPIKANRNITPMLETPLKDFVKAPGAQTPLDLNSSINMTPFTKILEANWKCTDINEIPTPNMTITPNFACYSSNVDLLTPFTNRPTDYSTSSSYYQPSDNEHNKSLENHLIEMEKKSVMELEATDYKSMFNKNIIGKKNLNLMRHVKPRISSSSDDSDTESDSSDIINKESNDTIIFRESSAKTYSLRLRSSSTNKKEKDNTVDRCSKKNDTTARAEKKFERRTPAKKIQRKSSVLEENDEAEDNNEKTEQIQGKKISILKKLELKRTRTIEVLQQMTSSKGNKNKRQFMKIKPIANVDASKKRGRKSNTPKKTSPSLETMNKILMEDLEHSDDSDIDVATLPTSKNDNNLIKENIERNDISASDAEAQKLVEGLKERGIHLMHKKSPNKQKSEETSQKYIDVKSPESPEKDRVFRSEYLETVSFESETIHIIHDESVSAPTKIFPEQKKKVGLYIWSEELEREIRIVLNTEYFVLLESNLQENMDININTYKNDQPLVLSGESNDKSGSTETNAETQIPTDQKEKIEEISSKKLSISHCDNNTLNRRQDIKTEGCVDTSLPPVESKNTKEKENISEATKTIKNINSVSSSAFKNPKKLLLQRSNEELLRSIASIIPDNVSMEKSVAGEISTTKIYEPEQIVDQNVHASKNCGSSQMFCVEDNDLMNYVVTGCDNETTADNTGNKKRKNRLEENSHPDEKRPLKLLKKINVDSFLDDIHGNLLS